MRIAVVGAGAIGASWSAMALAHGHDLVVCDPNPAAEGRVRAAVARYAADDGTGTAAEGTGTAAAFAFTTDLPDAVRQADVVFECGPERLEIKQEIVREIDRHAPAACLVLSSSSGLLPSDLQRACARHPGRVLVAHPFNPPHLMPLVEVVGGAATSADEIDRTMALLRDLGRHPIHVRAELPGHVANRLQAALWREAYSLIDRGVVTVADLDAAIAYGPGLRWALLGPIATQHLSSGTGGIRDNLGHLGPAIESWWADLGGPAITAGLVDALAAGVEAELNGEVPEQVALRRDAALRALVELKRDFGLVSSASESAACEGEDRG